MSNADVKRHAHLETAATGLLNTAARRLHLSARGYMRSIKVARAIADLAGSASVSAAHMGEALAYSQQT